jgi:hypothetical protein
LRKKCPNSGQPYCLSNKDARYAQHTSLSGLGTTTEADTLFHSPYWGGGLTSTGGGGGGEV